MQAANAAVNQAFNAVLAAEKAGANVTDLLSQLNVATNLLAQAENANRTGDSNTVITNVDNVLSVTQQIMASSLDAKQQATVASQNSFGTTIIFTVVSAAGQTYSLYVGVGNHLGNSAYYMVYVKLRNQTDLPPNATSGTPSPVSPLYECRFSIPDGKYLETPLNFSIFSAFVHDNQSVISQFTINGVHYEVNKPALWDQNSNSYYYQLIVELWLYNTSANYMQFNDRFVSLQMNLTTPSGD